MKKSFSKKLAIYILTSFSLILFSPTLNTFADETTDVNTPIIAFNEQVNETGNEQGNETDNEPKQTNAEKSELPTQFGPIAKALDGAEDCIGTEFNITVQNSEGEDESVSVPYIVTVIEEPLTFENRGNPGDDFVSRICFRNTLSMIERETGLEKTQVKMLKDCPDSARNLETPDGEKTSAPFVVLYSCEQVQVLLSKGGTTLIEGYIGTIYRWAASIVGIIAVTIIVISGIQISASGGDSEAISSAKTRIVQSLAGIAILFLASLILFTINPGFFTNPNSNSNSDQTTETTP